MKTKPLLLLPLLLIGLVSYYCPWLLLLLVKGLREWLLTPRANFRPVRRWLPKPGFFTLLILIPFIQPQSMPAVE